MNVSSSKISETLNQQFNFTVDKFPLSGPDGLKTSLYGLFRSDNSQHIGDAVSVQYVPHQTEDVLTLCEAAQEAFEGEVELKCHFREGHYVILQPSREERKAIFDGDDVFPRIMISAGYDGKAFKASMGYYRDLCKNLHRISSVNSTSVSIRHTSGLRGHMDDLIRDFQELKDSWGDLTITMEKMRDKRISMVEFLNAVYGEPEKEEGRGATMHKNRTEAIFQRLSREMSQLGQRFGANYEVSAWMAFNALQGYHQHDQSARKEYSGNFDRILRTMTDKNVAKAEALALSL